MIEFLMLAVAIVAFFLAKKYGYKLPRSAASSQQEKMRWSKESKAPVGGIVFMVVFLIALLQIAFSKGTSYASWAPVCVVGIAFLSGLLDDIAHTTPKFKLIVQGVCGLILAFHFDIGLTGSSFLDGVGIILFTVALMNAVNMLDNMDGIVAITSLPALGLIFILHLLMVSVAGEDSYPISAMMIALLVFLPFNWNPSKMYMGDSGSQMLSAFLSWKCIEILGSAGDIAVIDKGTAVWVIFLMLILFISDSLTVSINRLRAGLSPATGGKDHTTHHLARRIKKDYLVGMVYGLVATCSCIVALFVIRSSNDENLAMEIGAAMYLSSIFAVLYYLSRKNMRDGLFTYRT